MLGDIGDFCPYYKTLFIAKVIKILVVLVVSKTNGCSTYLAYKLDILLVVLGEKSITHAPSVLMAGYAAERVFLTVKNKSVVRVYLEATATKATAYVIDNLAIFNYFCLTAVEIGVLATVPKMNVCNLKDCLCFCGFNLIQLVFVLVVNGVNDSLSALKIFCVHLNLNRCVRVVHCGGNLYSGRSAKIQVKVGVVDTYYIYVSVKTAVEGKVSHLGVNRVVG